MHGRGRRPDCTAWQYSEAQMCPLQVSLARHSLYDAQEMKQWRKLLSTSDQTTRPESGCCALAGDLHETAEHGSSTEEKAHQDRNDRDYPRPLDQPSPLPFFTRHPQLVRRYFAPARVTARLNSFAAAGGYPAPAGPPSGEDYPCTRRLAVCSVCQREHLAGSKRPLSQC